MATVFCQVAPLLSHAKICLEIRNIIISRYWRLLCSVSVLIWWYLLNCGNSDSFLALVPHAERERDWGKFVARATHHHLPANFYIFCLFIYFFICGGVDTTELVEGDNSNCAKEWITNGRKIVKWKGRLLLHLGK